MADFDLFNGDADGIFSLLQLRAREPRDAELVTGVKRDIRLFDRIAGQAGEGDRVSALDISMARNMEALTRVLNDGADVFYCDHHLAGDVPEHPGLTAVLDGSKVMCTAFLIDTYLAGAHTDWAICGAYGDNFPQLAEALAVRSGLDLPMNKLRELGELVNYNAYGLELADLHFDPAKLYRTLSSYSGPIDFLDADTEDFATLKAGYASDWDVAQNAREADVSDAGQVLVLPAGAASNRIGGLFGNALVDEEPQAAFAVLTELSGEAAYRVSIRAPRSRKTGTASDLAVQFGGGGRAAAAGIDALPDAELDHFIGAFRDVFA